MVMLYQMITPLVFPQYVVLFNSNYFVGFFRQTVLLFTSAASLYYSLVREFYIFCEFIYYTKLEMCYCDNKICVLTRRTIHEFDRFKCTKKTCHKSDFFWCFITATFVLRLKGYLMMVFEAKVSITIWSLEGNVPSSKMTKSYFSIKLLCFHQPPIDITCVRRLWLYDKSVRKMVIGTF